MSIFYKNCRGDFIKRLLLHISPSSASVWSSSFFTVSYLSSAFSRSSTWREREGKKAIIIMCLCIVRPELANQCLYIFALSKRNIEDLPTMLMHITKPERLTSRNNVHLSANTYMNATFTSRLLAHRHNLV